MPIIPPPPDSISQCGFLVLLREKSTTADGAVDKAFRFIEAATPLVDMIISGPFREYTLHNRDHCKKLLHLAEAIIPVPTLQALSPLEYLTFIYAAYLHDMGMSLTSTERARILTSDEFQDSLQASEDLADALARARRHLDSAPEQSKFSIEAEIYQLQEAALAAFLRPRHASPDRYREVIASLKRHANRSDLFEYRGASFEELLIDICSSHNLDASVLAEVRGPYEERFPRRAVIGGAYLNAQFCAAVLRLTDILDFDRERTPRILFDSLGIPIRSLPGAEVSLREWQKHMAVHSLELTPDELIISAESHHPVIEKAIKEFGLAIEREVRDTLAILRQNAAPIATQYVIELPSTVRPQIRPVGYVYRDLSLSLNQSRVMSLLMGERLYPEPSAAIRELLQNCIDACSVRCQMESEAYTPRIAITADQDATERWWLEVSDNGCGMDEHVLSEYFLKVGNSYYSSPEFRRLAARFEHDQIEFAPLSRFGIGLIAVFLIADVVEVCTRSAYSPRRDWIQRRLRIDKLGSLAFVTEHQSDNVGTVVRLRLRSHLNAIFREFESQLVGYLQRTIVRPKLPILLHLPDFQLAFGNRLGFRLRENGRDVLSSKGLEAVLIDVERWSDRLSGTIGLVFWRGESGRLSHVRNGQQVRVGSKHLTPDIFLEGYGGNRITVNGFVMSMKGIGRLAGKGRNRVAVIFDVEVRGDKDVEYDISRQRIVGSGRRVVTEAFCQVILDGLRETGILERLEGGTRELIEEGLPEIAKAGVHQPALLEDEDILKEVERVLPKGVWPKGLHKQVAEELSISNSLSHRAINTLVKTKRVVRESEGAG